MTEPALLVIITQMINENFSKQLNTRNVGDVTEDLHLSRNGLGIQRTVDESTGGVQVAEVKQI